MQTHASVGESMVRGLHTLNVVRPIIRHHHERWDGSGYPDGLAKDADDLDCAMCLTGWATHRGGPIGYARQLGAQTVTARGADLAREYGPRFAPFASLSEFLSR